MSKLTIIIPAYNCYSKIHRAVNSVLCFNRIDIQLIIVDDCSLDETWNEVQRYKADRRVTLFKQSKNYGPSSARNLGLSVATGEFACFLDADDYFLPSAEDHISDAINNYNDSCQVFCFGYIINGNKSPRPKFKKLNYAFIFDKFSNTNTIVFRRKDFPSERFDERYRIGEDTTFWFKLLSKYRAVYIPKEISYYDYTPKLNPIFSHPLLQLDFEKYNLSSAEAITARKFITKNLNFRLAWARKVSLYAAFRKQGTAAAICWILGPRPFSFLWKVKSKWGF